MRTLFQIWRPMEKLLYLPDTLALIDGDTLDEMPAARENQQRNETESKGNLSYKSFDVVVLYFPSYNTRQYWQSTVIDSSVQTDSMHLKSLSVPFLNVEDQASTVTE